MIVVLASLFLQTFVFMSATSGDGLVIPKREYQGSLEEKSQQAILIYHTSPAIENERPKTLQDLILSIEVHGETDEFAWVIPLPSEPEVFKEDGKLFEELFNYVQFRQANRLAKKGKDSKSDSEGSALANEVEVLSREVVGDFEVTVVRERLSGTLNPWLADNGFREIVDADDVLEFYRNRRYVFACIKYSAEALSQAGQINSHPLRFRFETGGFDSLYFPMKMTGLQTEPFDINLYVFRPSWINAKLNKFGFRHRGLELVYRDWDTPDCMPNAGKTYSDPESDPFLKNAAKLIPTVTDLFQRLYPGKRFYLTQIRARELDPEQVRYWSDDLWLFPHYTDRRLVPIDARQGGVASTAWPNEEDRIARSEMRPDAKTTLLGTVKVILATLVFAGLLIIVPLGLRRLARV